MLQRFIFSKKFFFYNQLIKLLFFKIVLSPAIKNHYGIHFAF